MRVILLLVTLFVLYPFLAFAAGDVPTPATDTADWLKALYTAATSGEYKIAAGLVLVGIYYAVNRWTPIKPKSKTGRIALAFVLSLLTTLGLALAADAPLSLATIASVIGTAAASAGVWEWVKDWKAASAAKSNTLKITEVPG
jgi:hypothetical protein